MAFDLQRCSAARDGPDLRQSFDGAWADWEAGPWRTIACAGTFTPLFPNGYYFSLAGLTGYTNLVHLKPSLTLKPAAALGVAGAPGPQ